MNRQRKIHRILMLTLSVAASAFGLLACGDANTNSTPPKYTVDNVCPQIAPELCTTRENCCLQAGAYDETGCVTFETGECEKNVADVKAGKMTFDGESIDPCIEAVKPYADKCRLTIPDFYSAPTDLAVCAKVFAGTLPEGSVCERDAQCASSPSDKEFVRCDKGTKKCTTIRFLAKDAACTLSTGTNEFCDEGLYCNANILTMKGTCQTATPLGSPCTLNAGGFSLECGLGYYCDSTTKVCAKAKAGGEACSFLLDCQSLKCTNSVCTDPDPLYGKEQCTGTP